MIRLTESRFILKSVFWVKPVIDRKVNTTHKKFFMVLLHLPDIKSKRFKPNEYHLTRLKVRSDYIWFINKLSIIIESQKDVFQKG